MFKILKGGCDTKHQSSFFMSRPNGLEHYIILIVKSSGIFQIGSRQYRVSPSSGILIRPHTPYSYSNPDGRYSDDWLHFSVPDTAHFNKLYPVSNSFFPLGTTDSYTFLIKQLLWENSYSKPPYDQQNIDALFTVLLNHLLNAYSDKDSISVSPHYQSQLQAIRLNLQDSVTHAGTIGYYSEKLGISQSYFQHLYSKFFGISFQKDLIHIRIEHAKYLLVTSDLSVENIAQLCGYTNYVHFYRQFKEVTGITPSKYRHMSAL